jgi:hypothetical protein
MVGYVSHHVKEKEETVQNHPSDGKNSLLFWYYDDTI